VPPSMGFRKGGQVLPRAEHAAGAEHPTDGDDGQPQDAQPERGGPGRDFRCEQDQCEEHQLEQEPIPRRACPSSILLTAVSAAAALSQQPGGLP